MAGGPLAQCTGSTLARTKSSSSRTRKQARKAPVSSGLRDARAQIVAQKKRNAEQMRRIRDENKKLNAQLKDLRKLQKQGLYAPRVSLDKVRAKITSGGKRALREWRDVLTGLA